MLQTRQAVLPPLTEVLHSALFLAAARASGDLAFVVLLCRLQPHVRAVQMSWSQIQVGAARWKRCAGCWIRLTSRDRPQGASLSTGSTSGSCSMM
ncbi:hypothetical protein SF83666_b65900 (plasmid) [Sinorhizobium fredii CCBAU 83666]|nr:hypothetical protein SF83666_b65900 [Sinorhizobium fredii CCBAU 83666]